MRDVIQKSEDEQRASATANGTNLKLVPIEKRKLLRRQAQDLLTGKAKWTPGWTDLRPDGRPLAGM